MIGKGSNKVTSTGPLRRPPAPENLPGLFSILRSLTLSGDLSDALTACARITTDIFPGSELVIALARGDKPMEFVAGAPESAFSRLSGSRLRLGSIPCGLALEKEAPVSISISPNDAGPENTIVEAPISQDRRVIGAISMRLSRPETADSSSARSLEFVQWAAFLMEESLGLRTALFRRAQEDIRQHQGGSPTARPGSMPTTDVLAAAGQQRQPRPAPEEISFHGLIGTSNRMKEVYTLIRQVAGTEATVLVTGESGTGKELAAKAIHDCGRRAQGPFIAVNCSSLPESIIESELFGHERGAFTGAIATRQGRFEAAQNGTLFLDEIGDLSPAVQVKLLRILQERSFERVGGNRTLKTNARIIAATHRDLLKEVAEGRFREDLYFRLAVFPIHLPPLRERGADILLLADWFAEKAGQSAGISIRRISSPALDLLMIYHWPGNVRELENCIARASILSTDGVIHAYHLPPSLQSATSTGTEPTSTFDAAVARLEKELLVEALKIERGNAVQAARRLGITERRLRFAMRKYKLDGRPFKTKMS